MALTLTSAIETALATGHIEAVDVVECDFGSAKRYWSDRPLSLKASDGVVYLPRIKSVSTLPVATTGNDDEFTIELDNSNYYARDLEDRGLRLHRAKIWVHRIYTNLNPPDNIITNYAGGTIVGYPMDAEICELKCTTGLLGLSRNALWKIEHACSLAFADDLRCPYAPQFGRGLPERKFRGTATGGSSTTLIDTAADFSSAETGWWVLNLTDKSIGQITTVATTTLTVDSFRGGTDNVFAASDVYLVGPAYTSCGFSVSNCQERGMFGIGDTQAPADLNLSQRRYFTGYATPARVPFQTKVKDATGKRRGPFTRTAFGNDGLDGTPIPVAFGTWRNNSMILLGLIPNEDGRVHALWIPSVGRCYSVHNITIDGHFVDDVDQSGNASEKDSFILWGFGAYSGADDPPSYPDELTLEQRRLAVGVRSGRAFVRNVNLDTYVSNPYLFANAAGMGVSFSGLSVIRTRSDPTNVLSDGVLPTGAATLTGVAARIVPGSDPNSRDQHLLASASWTHFPNPVQVAYTFLRDGLWGAGLDDAQIDLPAAVVASDYCEADLESSQTTDAIVGGVVKFGPDDSDNTSGSRNWFATDDELGFQDYRGDRVTVLTAGGNITRDIENVRLIELGGSREMDPTIGIGIRDDGDSGGSGESERYWIVVTTDAFPVGQTPANGDTWQIIDQAKAVRFKFHGALTEPSPVHEMLQSILDNCGGRWVQKNGKIAIVIPQQVDLSTVEADTIFTDRGSSRNIVYRNERSTARWEPDDLEEAPNSIIVEYFDRHLGYETVRRRVVNLEAQKYAGSVFGERRREKDEAVLSLNGTNNLNQALRLGARRLRERGPLPGNRANGTLTFEVAVHDAQKLVPWEDVHICESDILPGYLPRTFRLVGKEENAEGLTMTLSWRPFYNYFYDDTTEDVGVEDLPREVEFDPTQLPIPVKIESVTDQGYADSEGNYIEKVRVSYTPPQTTS